MSATSVSPKDPPMTPAPNLIAPACLLRLSAFIVCLTMFLLPALIELPSLRAFNTFFANLLPCLNPIVLGIPIDTNASVILPAPFFSAISSNGFNVSKNCSTFAAVFESAPRSISSAAKETIPSGTLIIPDAIPAAPAVYQLVSLFSSSGIKGTNAI